MASENVHGKRSSYNKGCRCVECGAAQRDYMREYMRRKKTETGVWPSAAYRDDVRDRERRSAKRAELGLTDRQRWAESNRARDQRRRARKYEATIENFAAAEVYDRDEWMCGICFQLVDPNLKHPDPMSVSLDHIVPLSKGGAHSRDNTRCSHLSCNVRRGNRPAVGRIRLRVLPDSEELGRSLRRRLAA